MPKMKEVNTPFKLLGIKYFKDENGRYYKKVGGSHREQVKPFWKMKRLIVGIPLLVILVLGFAAYKIGMNLASEKVVKELSTQIPKKDIQELLKDPSIQKVIEEEVGADKKQAILEQFTVPAADQTSIPASATAGNDDAKPALADQKAGGETSGKSNSKLNFKTREDVLKFLLTKFSMGELTELAKTANGGITDEEKAVVRDEILSRLSPEEYNAVKVYAIIELTKQNQ